MSVVGVRVKPLIAVVSRLPLFFEAVVGAFEGIADVRPVPTDEAEAVAGLVRAFRPDAVIVEGVDHDLASFTGACVQVDIDAARLNIRHEDGWRLVESDISPQTIRNATIALLYGGETA